MKNLKRVLAICGSTRAASSNRSLIEAIARLARDRWSTELFEGLSSLPQFNPDEDTDRPPAAVAAFREKAKAADGILICTPEYALGVPGALKNAIDWTVASMEFSGKPVALVTASSAGRRAHESLLGTLLVIESKMVAETALHIPFVQAKLTTDGLIKDAATGQQLDALTGALAELMAAENSGMEERLLRSAGI